MTAPRYNIRMQKRFRRADVAAAVLIAAGFHAAMLFGFSVASPEGRTTVSPRTPVSVLDLEGAPPEERAVVERFMRLNDPSGLSGAGGAAAFSRRGWSDDGREILPAPPRREREAVAPLPPLEERFALNIVAPAREFAPSFAARVLVDGERSSVPARFPFAELDGDRVELDFPPELAVSEATEPASVLEFECSPGMLPRVRVVESCGDPALDAAAVRLFVGKLGGAEGVRRATVRWRPGRSGK